MSGSWQAAKQVIWLGTIEYGEDARPGEVLTIMECVPPSIFKHVEPSANVRACASGCASGAPLHRFGLQIEPGFDSPHRADSAENSSVASDFHHMAEKLWPARRCHRLSLANSSSGNIKSSLHFPAQRTFRLANPGSWKRVYDLFVHRSDDLLGRVLLPDGKAVSTLRLVSAPTRESSTDQSAVCRCILYGETTDTIDTSLFQRRLNPTLSEKNMYTMKPSSVSGLGAFASRDIEIGEDIIAERPFIVFPYLPLAERPEFFDSSDPGSQSDVFQRNASWLSTPLPGSYGGGYGVMSRHITRINHSCQPNVVQRWDWDSLTLSVRAVSRIRKGEELLRSYLDPTLLAPRAERLKKLANIYEFECSCPSCSLPPEDSMQSDLNRRQIYEELDKRFATGWDIDTEYFQWLADPSLPDDHLVNHSAEIVRLLDQERVGWTRLRMFHCIRLMRAYSALGDKENTRRWAKRIVLILEPGLETIREFALKMVLDTQVFTERRAGSEPVSP
ncbi:hypothetical protein DFH06DRAFT_1299271 [Mycena polygramma]|nr:hypothetical protein DFH06DRAFT_1299271 [Mycena polygramma]